MSQSILAAQLYTIRDFTKTRADFAESMRKISEIGYRVVQLSSVGAIGDAFIKRVCDDNGLSICNTHVGVDQLQNDIEDVIAQHELWDCRHVAIGGMPPEFRDSEAGFRSFAVLANGIGERLAEAGLSFSYHNHSFEFVKFGDRSGLDIFFAETDPRYVSAELDTYWIQHGGADPIVWIDRLAGRMPVIHLKDMVMLPVPHPPAPSPTGREGERKVPPSSWGRDLGWGPPQQAMAEVGEGNMNFPGILAACRRAGVEFYAVEQDICQRDPFESLAISYRNLRAMGLE
ncbi:MAG: sugar phosphate isomerase/epimerase [Chloroflexota bacterium]|nr:sugar phosphate isomerase/epimerase [Chloroflexota bacterium]